MFCDSAFGAPYVERLKTMGYLNVHEVRFGETTTPVSVGGKPLPGGKPGEVLDLVPANMRAYMHQRGKDWLGRLGCIDAHDTKLASDLVAPSYHLNRSDCLVIESKADMIARGCVSPDDSDSLFLTFAAPVRQTGKVVTRRVRSRAPFEGRRGLPSADKDYGWMA